MLNGMALTKKARPYAYLCLCMRCESLDRIWRNKAEPTVGAFIKEMSIVHFQSYA